MDDSADNAATLGAMSERYAYIGPASVLARAMEEPAGVAITDRGALARWLLANDEATREGATFVVTDDGVLRVAPRRSEHVACARSELVLTAGEIVFARGANGSLKVSEVTNQSTGYAPEPSSFPAVAGALDALGIERPATWSAAFVFRRCPRCA